MKRCKVGLVGIGGMGDAHLAFLRSMADRGRAELCAACDRDLARYAPNLEKHGFRGVRQYGDFDAFLRAGEALDLVVISTPIHLHRSMFCKTVEAGYNVLLEKPPAVTLQDLDAMRETLAGAKVLGAVGFQHTAEKSFVAFQKRLEEGVIGEVCSVRAQGIWRRYRSYFARTPWAGRLRLGGQYVLDGTVNNPFAHLIQNALLLARTGGRSSQIAEVRAELYHANPIESEDTSCVKIRTKGGVDILFAATIAAQTEEAPFIRVVGSKGEGFWDYEGNFRFARGENDVPFETAKIDCDAPLDLYDSVFDFLTGESDRVCCTLEDTRDFVLAGNLAFVSSGLTHGIGDAYVRVAHDESGEYLHIPGVNDLLHRAVRENRLYSECGAPWGVPSRSATAEGFTAFTL